MFKNILVPVDGSNFSTNAARVAVNIAEKYGSNITLLHVISYSHLPTIDPSQTSLVITEEILTGLKKQGEKILQDPLEAIGPKTVNVNMELTWGSPAQVIMEKANDKPYNLIVMGSRGRGGIAGLLLGSVSNRVSRLAACPVMIVKDDLGDHQQSI